MSKNQKSGLNTKLIIAIAAAAVLLIAAIIALKFYSDITAPENLFDPSAVAAATPAPAASFVPDASAAPTPTQDPDKVLLAQADQEMMTNRTNVLALGIDQSVERESWGSFRTDTMILVSIDFTTNDVDMISIPRDSYVKIYDGEGNLADPLQPMDKINNAFSAGGGAQRNGFEYTLTTVEKLIGVKVDYYCAFNMNVVKEIVDAMGGVVYDVDTEVHMNGRTYELGLQHLDGQGVLDYCRQRKGSSDIARIDRQQRMLSAILDQLKSSNQIVNLPAIYTAVESNLLTNLNFKQICSLALVALRMDMEQLDRYTIQGGALDINGRNCWCLYAEQLQQLVHEVWGADVTVDPEIDYYTLQSQQGAGMGLVSAELSAAYAAITRANAILDGYPSVIDAANTSALRSHIQSLESAIAAQDIPLIISCTQSVGQQCDSICTMYGISIY